MYLPAHFAQNEAQAIDALLRERPLATLVRQGVAGLAADHVPMLWQRGAAGMGVLSGHVARANALAREGEGEGVAVLALFGGAQAYVSPAWYPSKREHGKVVPTWNYAVVHAHGRLRVRDDPAWVRDLVDRLTRVHEAPRAEPWSIDDAPAEYIEALLRHVVGIEIEVERLEAKWKTSQNQPAANRAGVARALEAHDGYDERTMAEWIKQLGSY